jgi:hypothetical protein
VVVYLDQSRLYAASTARNEENFGFPQKKNFSSQSSLELLHACSCHIGFYQWAKDSPECYISQPFSLLHFQCFDPNKMSSEREMVMEYWKVDANHVYQVNLKNVASCSM